MPSLEQRRAAHALEAARAAADRDDRVDYRAYAARLGPTILTSGLGQALAMELAGGGAHQQLFHHVAAWLTGDDGPYQGAEDLMRAIVDGEHATYRRAQVEALQWLSWHVKFCRALIEERD